MWHIHIAYASAMYGMKYLIYTAYMPMLVHLLVSFTYLAITCKVYIAVGFVLAYKFKNGGSVCPFSTMAVCITFVM